MEPVRDSTSRPSAIRAEHPAVWSGLSCPACHCTVSRERLEYAQQYETNVGAQKFARGFVVGGSLAVIFLALAHLALRAVAS